MAVTGESRRRMTGAVDFRLMAEVRMSWFTAGLSPTRDGSRRGAAVDRPLESDVLVNLRPPRLVLVREPDLLRVERPDQPLAFRARLVGLGEEDRHVAADDH